MRRSALGLLALGLFAAAWGCGDDVTRNFGSGAGAGGEAGSAGAAGSEARAGSSNATGGGGAAAAGSSSAGSSSAGTSVGGSATGGGGTSGGGASAGGTDFGGAGGEAGSGVAGAPSADPVGGIRVVWLLRDTSAMPANCSDFATQASVEVLLTPLSSSELVSAIFLCTDDFGDVLDLAPGVYTVVTGLINQDEQAIGGSNPVQITVSTTTCDRMISEQCVRDLDVTINPL